MKLNNYIDKRSSPWKGILFLIHFGEYFKSYVTTIKFVVCGLGELIAIIVIIVITWLSNWRTRKQCSSQWALSMVICLFWMLEKIMYK